MNLKIVAPIITVFLVGQVSASHGRFINKATGQCLTASGGKGRRAGNGGVLTMEDCQNDKVRPEKRKIKKSKLKNLIFWPG